MSFQTSAQTSCCSIANLTLASVVNGDGAKTMWKTVSGGAVRNESHNPAAPWTTWAGALKNAGCSAGAEGQDPRSAAGGWPNWLNMSVGYPFPIQPAPSFSSPFFPEPESHRQFPDPHAPCPFLRGPNAPPLTQPLRSHAFVITLSPTWLPLLLCYSINH